MEFKGSTRRIPNAQCLISALLNHGMISPNLERITNSFTRQFIPHLCNAPNFLYLRSQPDLT
ncbi:MAG: hypothetical protein KME55_09380 [Nostoc indistinguendum CM1-VF10]|nr:hypothetical protein [Nostoc indistinguendum CM1-VF10]